MAETFAAPMMYDADENRYYCAACLRTADRLAFIGNHAVVYRVDPIEVPPGSMRVEPCGHRFDSIEGGAWSWDQPTRP